jgi:hypothetical protein
LIVLCRVGQSIVLRWLGFSWHDAGFGRIEFRLGEDIDYKVSG